jgi:hypothetical protein
MRWKKNPKKKRESWKKVERRYFALFPVTIGDETRWLEMVTVRGHWWYGASGNWWWEYECFID